MCRRDSGFTLIEMMVTIGVIAILAAMASPAADLVISNRRASAINDALAAINYARNEAIARGMTVTICRSASTSACGAGTGWEAGWFVFTDPNGNGVLEVADVVSPDTTAILKTHGTLPSKFTLRGSGTLADRITFTPTGSSFDTGNLTICDARGFGSTEIYARTIEVSIGGTSRSTTPTTGSCT